MRNSVFNLPFSLKHKSHFISIKSSKVWSKVNESLKRSRKRLISDFCFIQWHSDLAVD